VGIVQNNPALNFYPYGSTVQLIATPGNTNTYFRLWGGAAFGNDFSPLDFVVTNASPVNVALFAGILVVTPRVSPLAAGLPGLAFIGLTVLYGVRVREAVRYIPLKHDVFGDGFEALLFNGILAVAGIVMIIPLFVPSRWRRRAAANDGYNDGYDSGYGSGYQQGGQGEAPGLITDQWSTGTAPYPETRSQPPF